MCPSGLFPSGRPLARYRLYFCIVNAATESPRSPHASFISAILALGIRVACSLLMCVCCSYRFTCARNP